MASKLNEAKAYFQMRLLKPLAESHLEELRVVYEGVYDKATDVWFFPEELFSPVVTFVTIDRDTRVLFITRPRYAKDREGVELHHLHRSASWEDLAVDEASSGDEDDDDDYIDVDDEDSYASSSSSGEDADAPGAKIVSKEK